MKNFFKKAGKTVIIVLVCALVIICTFWTLGGAGIFPLRGITAPVHKLIGRGMDAMSRLTGYMRGCDEVEAENLRLKEYIADMEQRLLLAYDAEQENAQLRELLGLSASNPDFEFADASIIARTADSWSTSLTIDVGTRSGVSKGCCVVTEHGCVIGCVTSAGLNYSTVTTLTDSQSSIGAYIPKTGVTAVAQGSFKYMPRGLLTLNYLEDGDICVGDAVFTSGVGEIYPKGLLIGYVSSVESDSAGFSDFGIITPAAETNKLTKVFVITNFEVGNET